MGTVVIKRPPRRPAPEIPVGEVPVEPPPEIPAVTGGRWQQALMLLPMLGGSVAMAMMFGRGGGAYSYVVGAMFGLSSLAMLVTSWGGAAGSPNRSELMAARREYLRHLATLRRRVRATADRQRVALLYRHPDPARLWSTVDSHRVWERRPRDPDFAVVRVGLGPQTLATPLIPPVTRPLEDLEPMTAGALRRFLDAYAVVPDLPVALSLRSFARVFVRSVPNAGPGTTPDGPGTTPARSGTAGDDQAQGLARAVLTQLAVFHAPDELLIAVCAGPERRAAWEWVKWLPHAQHPSRTDALGPARLVTSSAVELERLLDNVLASRPRFGPTGPVTEGPHLVVILDGGDLTGSTTLGGEGGVDGVTVFDLDSPPPRLPDRVTLLLELHGDRLLSTTVDGRAEVGTPDRLDVAEAEAVARRLAPLRLAATGPGSDTPVRIEPGLPELLGFGDPENWGTEQGWAPRPDRDRLRVPVGVGVDGGAIELDLKESAQDGMGPHGLLIGATGSGKSELLRTLVLGLAATHSSAALNFVLVDYKGGATFATLDRLPHTAAMITNLAHELPLVDRMVDAINGELVRRQELLRRSGNYASLRDYERARAGGVALAPLPSLLVVCDEFSELLAAKPDFIELFVQIGRLGRSLGVHLLLASQRLEEGRLRGLDTHLSYRIGLRTFSALESRTVLGVPDAYELPRSPGHGYLRFGNEPLVRFKAAYVSGPVRRRDRSGPDGPAPGTPRLLTFATHFVPVPEVPQPVETTVPDEPAAASLLDVLVDRIAGQGPPAHRVWLPPLGDPPALDDLLGPVGTDPVRGFGVGNPELHGALQVPVALVDKPFEQRRDLLWLALDGAAGHVAVVGGPQSGKSGVLRTLICALALTHTPAEVQVYCLDFGGGSLTGLRDLPHVGGVAGRADSTAVRRTVGELTSLLADRERRFAAAGIESMAEYRRRRASALTTGHPSGDPFGDVFLVVDGWSTVRGEYDDLEPAITDLATRGLSYGVHVVASATRWMDFRPAIRDLFGSRVELRLGDPTDSVVSRRAATNVPDKTPGRGITAASLHFLTALPRLAGGEPADLVKAVAGAWSGPPAPRVRLLPPVLGYADLDRSGSSGLHLPVGIAESDLRPVVLDFASEPHFVLFGDAECGKSSFLRALATTISQRFAPEQARMILVDYRRSLLGAVQSEHLIGYGTAASATADLIESAAGYLQRRIAGPDVTPGQLRDRSWWTGPELFVLVDDYDLVATGPTNPLRALEEYLPQARDVGLHLVLARRAGGAARGLFEPVMQRLHELSTAGLVMAGKPEEGPLVGSVRPGPLPPGRGRLVTRAEGVRLVQLAYLPPS
ncbi:type VII secretion protein EccCa [Micromonospora echinofusca]|uniref:Type VII secretion protein EccCa n=1 Tax=Micromonospora echinofusca TaxID=47858 RepID=A0ABS3VKI6_MICEH|nr:type VII secretion protein EccCa [Micromonospora echinofusca]MBO4204996.1 type VII secretion protein EccCa [Micromonospora echinofusca]